MKGLRRKDATSMRWSWY